MENINLLRSIAWSFHRTTGLDYDDLFQEAYLAYNKAMSTYTPDKGKITTYAYRCISNRLQWYLTQENKYRNAVCSIDDIPDIPITQTTFFESLSEDARGIADVILACPRLFSVPTASEAQQRVSNIVKRKGWSTARIWGGIQELKMVFS